MTTLIDVSDFPAEKLIYTLSWLVIKGSTEPCDLWRRGRDARAVQPRVIPPLGSAVASWRPPQGSRNVAPLVRCRFLSPAPIGGICSAGPTKGNLWVFLTLFQTFLTLLLLRLTWLHRPAAVGAKLWKFFLLLRSVLRRVISVAEGFV